MRILGASVLVMESLIVGFAILLAMKEDGNSALILGVALAIALLLTAGLLKHRAGWFIGSALQVVMLAYGFIVTAFFIVGGVFAVLWVAAIIVGRRGEAIRATLMASPRPNV